MLDLNTLDTKAPAEAGIVVELENPFEPSKPFVDDEGIPYSITILGSDAGKVRAKAKKQLNHFLRDLRRNKDADADEGEQELTDKLAAATLAWHLPTLDGEVMPPPTEHIARKLYADPRFPWIAEQLTKAMVDRSRFFKKSSSSS
jgi:hypothetical protein